MPESGCPQQQAKENDFCSLRQLSQEHADRRDQADAAIDVVGRDYRLGDCEKEIDHHDMLNQVRFTNLGPERNTIVV